MFHPLTMSLGQTYWSQAVEPVAAAQGWVPNAVAWLLTLWVVKKLRFLRTEGEDLRNIVDIKERNTIYICICIHSQVGGHR